MRIFESVLFRSRVIFFGCSMYENFFAHFYKSWNFQSESCICGGFFYDFSVCGVAFYPRITIGYLESHGIWKLNSDDFSFMQLESDSISRGEKILSISDDMFRDFKLFKCFRIHEKKYVSRTIEIFTDDSIECDIFKKFFTRKTAVDNMFGADILQS